MGAKNRLAGWGNCVGSVEDYLERCGKIAGVYGKDVTETTARFGPDRFSASPCRFRLRQPVVLL